MSEQNSPEQRIVDAVRDAYSARAKDSIDPSYAQNVAAAFGYSAEDLQQLPADANLGLSCGNPTAAASLKPGEVVVDLGSGGGIDVFLAASKVGPTGRAIGLDMSEDMLALARRNAAKHGLAPPRVSFVHAVLTEPLPLASASVDCILSNCVVNLLPGAGKAHVMREAFRVLKPGGRIAFSDIIAKKPMPDAILTDMIAYVGCIAGAIPLDEYTQIITDAGFPAPVLVDTKADLNVYFEPGNDMAFGCCVTPAPAAAAAPAASCCPPATNGTTCGAPAQTTSCCAPAPAAEKACCAPQTASGLAKPTLQFDSNDYVGSYQIYAVKPGPASDAAAPEPLLDWAAPFPAPRAEVRTLAPEELAALLGAARADVAVLDVRHAQDNGRAVRGHAFVPAGSFYGELPRLVERFRGTRHVVFYCWTSSGKAPRCAKWYQDKLDEAGITTSAAYILEEGIKGWVKRYAGDEQLVVAV